MNINEMIAHAEMIATKYVDDGVLDLKYNGNNKSGCSRLCEVIDDYAFKAVHSSRNASQNRSEWDFYCMTTDAIRKMLAKPVYISRNGNVLVMERITPGIYEYGFCDRIESATQEAHGFKITDLHNGNLGTTHDGRSVVCDYGSIEWKVSESDPEYRKVFKGKYCKTRLGVILRQEAISF